MDKSEQFWDRSAPTYDQDEGRDEQTTTKIIEKTKTSLKAGDLVLDFGCGTGRLSNDIAGSVKMIQAIDISSNMIEIAKKKAEARKIENIEFTHSTIFNEIYQPGSFDVILAFYILHLIDEPQRVIRRMYELLKPGGLLISTTPCIGGKTFQWMVLTLVGKTGLIPMVRSFKISELEASIVNGNFEIVETECVVQSTHQYFIVAKKV